MKKISFITTLFLAIFSFSNSNAQAFEKGGKYLNLNLGAAYMAHVGGDYYGTNSSWGWGGVLGYRGPVTGQLGIQMEFGIHDYVGLGFNTGVGFAASALSIYSSEVNVPAGVFANFHFFQLIADKTGKDIHADKLDVYAGVNVGSGVALPFINGDVYPAALAYGGLQAGVRYYFNPKVGVNAEVGFGKSIFNGGVVFNLGN